MTDSYEQFLQDRAARASRQSALEAPALTAEQAAQARRLGASQGIPAAEVATDLPRYQEVESLDRLTEAGRQHPGMGRWLQKDPLNAAAARDDLDALQEVARASKKQETWFGEVVRTLMLPGTSDTSRELGERFGAATVGMAANVLEQGASYVGGAARAGTEPLRDILGIAMRDAQLRADRESVDQLRIAREAFSDTLGAEAFARRQAAVGATVRERQAELQARVTRPTSALDAVMNPGSTFRYYGGLFTDSLPAMLASMATRRPMAGSALMGETVLASGFSRRRAEGEGVLAATAKSAPEAGIEVAGSIVPLSKAFTAGSRRFLTVPLSEGVSEAATEVAQTEASDVIDGRVTPTGDKVAAAFDAFLVGAPGGLVEAGLGGDSSKVPEATTRRTISAARAAQDRGYLDGLVKAAAGSKLRQASPGQFQDFVQEQVGDAVVYLPVAQAERLFQSSQVDAAEAALQLTGDASAWEEAQATGGDLAIPLSRYLTHLADAHDAVGPAVRLSPSGHEADAGVPMPSREEILADIEAYQAEMAAGREPDARAEGPLGEVYDEFYGQLLDRVGDVAAAQQASVMQRLFGTLAERTGLSVDNLRQRFAFNVNAPTGGLQGPRARGVDIGIDPLVEAALSGRTFSDREIFGESLVDAIVSLGGVRPSSVGGGDLLAADAQLRPGLLNMTGRTVEDMARRLVDDGWGSVFGTTDWAGRPDYRELVELIQSELSGKPVHIPAGEGDRGARSLARREFRENVEAVREAFAAHGRATGVDPATLPREEQRTIAQRVLAEQPGALEQPAFHGTHARGIEQFTLQKIGTGEGAQAYGWGLYFASSRDIAEWYRESVSARRSGPVLVLTDDEGTVRRLPFDGEAQAAISNLGPPQPEGFDDDEWRDAAFEAAGEVAGFIENSGRLPDSRWVDNFARMDAGSPGHAERVVIAREMVARLQESGGIEQMEDVARFSYTTDDGTTASADIVELAGFLQDEFEGGVESDDTVDDVVGYLVRAAEATGSLPTMEQMRGNLPKSQWLLAEAVLEFAGSIGLKYTPPGQLYQVEVPESSELLDYDAPMSEQPEFVIDALAQGGYVIEADDRAVQKRAEEILDADAADWADEEEGRDPVDFSNSADFDGYMDRARAELAPPGSVALPRNLTGKGLYAQLMDEAGFRLGLFEGRGEYQRAASEALLAMGIKGLRYLDATSRRGRSDPSHNFVIWDEGAVSAPKPLYQEAIPADDEVARLRQQLADLEAALGEERRLRRESPVTGLRNRIAFDEDATAGLPFVGSADMDGLKRINDTHGHPVGDAMLESIGAVMLAVQAAHPGVRLYHASGDEFMARAASQEEAAAALAEVRDRLESVVVEVEVAEGDATVRYEYHGIGLSYGLGASLEQAEQGLRADKQSRLAAGIREEARADAGGALGPSRRAVRRPAGQGAVGEGAQPDGVSGELFQSEQPFHSALLRSVEDAKGAPKNGNAAAWRGWLDGAQRRGEFRLEEREWLGIDEWLSGQSSVTREQLQEFVRASQLHVKETRMGPPATPARADAAPVFDPSVLDNLPFIAREITDTSVPGWGVYDPDGNLSASYGTQAEAERAAYDYSSGWLRAREGVRLPRMRGLVVARVTPENAQDVGIPGQWALFDVLSGTDDQPGELLAPVDVPDSASYARAMHAGVLDAAEMDATNGSTLVEEYGSVAPVGAPASTPAPYSSMTLPGGGNYRVLLLKLPRTTTDTSDALLEEAAQIRARHGVPGGVAAEDAPEPARSELLALRARGQALLRNLDRDSQPFTGGHFEQNTVAHVRFDERVDADGNRVLFINELQSDWHQKGRSRGYASPANLAALRAEYAAVAEERSALLDEISVQGGFASLDPNEQGEGTIEARYNALDQRMRDVDARIQSMQFHSIPDAPFKTTWPELVMKRMVRWAAEHGFDRVAWPTVEMVPQIEGWGMSLEEIRSSPDTAKRFGAILARYETDLPRIAKAMAKKFGGAVVTSQLKGGADAQTMIEPAPEFDIATEEDWDAMSGPDPFSDGSPPRISHAPMLWNGEERQVAIMLADNGVQLTTIGGGDMEDAFIPWAELASGDAPATPYAAIAAFHEAWSAPIDPDSLTGGMSLWDSESSPHEIRPLVRRSITVPSIEITPAMREAALAGLPLFQTGGERGSIVIGDRDAQGRRVFDITLLANADRSTFLHEAGHAFAEILGDLAGDVDAPAQIVEDFHAMLRFIGAEGATDAERAAWWRTKPINARREAHERFARGFEAYLMEGKAPSAALRRAFASFKVWLTELYKTLRGLNIELTDEVRGVFDRLLATDAEIAEVRAGSYQEALITDAIAVGMDEAAFEAYNRAVLDARSDAEAALASDVLRAEHRARKAMLGEERRRIRAEVEAQTRQLPIYRALRWLRNGKLPDGSDVPERVKLSKEALLDNYGQTFLQHLRGTYSVEGGVTPDQAAALLGFADGATLIDALVNAPPLAEVVAADTDRILRDRYPDPMLDGSLPERALAATHREKQAQAMLLEVQALERHTEGRVRSQAALLKEVARRMIAEKQARKLSPATYRAAEAKAGREAFEAAAKQDWPAALAARRRQLLNHLLFAEANRARREVESAQKFLRRFTKKKRRAAIGKAGADYLEQIDGLLEGFDLKAISGRAADRRARLRDFVARKQAEGVPIDLPEAVLDEAGRLPFRDLSVAQVRQLREAVTHLAHLADLKNWLLLGNELRDRAEVDEAAGASVRAALGVRPARLGDALLRDRARASGMQVRALTGGASDLARELDGHDSGAVWRNTVGVIRDAMNNEVTPRLQAAQQALARIWLQHYTEAELRDLGTLRRVPGVRDAWSKGRILALALNWGNEGNRTALLEQVSWREALDPDGRMRPEELQVAVAEQVHALLATLTARDWRFVEDAWALVDGFWPEIAAAQKRRTGLVPEKVPASPFEVVTADGQTLRLAGGYYPLKYEADTTRARAEESDDFYKAVQAGRTSKAATRNGHTIERVGSGGRSVRLSLGVLDTHLRDVVRDVWLGDAVNYVHQVLRGPAFTAAANRAGMVEHVHALEIWLQDVASGDRGLRLDAENFARTLRGNLTASVLTYKAVSAALQVTGFLQSAVVLGKKPMLYGLSAMAKDPVGVWARVNADSPFMRIREQTSVEAVQEVSSARSGRVRATRTAMFRWGYYLMGRVQRVVDVATWLAAEAKGLEDFDGDVARARQFADDVVARAQSSQDWIDKNALQRGTTGDNVRQSEFIAATTSLMSYMMAKTNVAYARTKETNFRDPAQALSWATDMVLLYTVEALLVAVIRGNWPDDEEEDGTVVDDWLALASLETAGSLAGGIPGVAQLFTELRGYDSKGVVSRAWQAVGRAWEQTRQGELDKAAIKSFVNVGGAAYGIPSAQTNKTIDAISARRDGADVAPYEYLTGPKDESP